MPAPAQFLDATDGDGYGAVWHVARHTGLRCGELLGLRWEDIDLARKELRVRQTLAIGNHQPRFGEPKTASGKRTIALDTSTVAALREHRAHQNAQRLKAGPAWQDHGLVFASDVGTPIDPTNLGKRFAALVKAAGVRRITLHGMRHTHATLLVLQGIHPKVVSERLGHASISLTLQTYSLVLPQMQSEAADAFARALKTSS